MPTRMLLVLHSRDKIGAYHNSVLEKQRKQRAPDQTETVDNTRLFGPDINQTKRSATKSMAETHLLTAPVPSRRQYDALSDEILRTRH